MVSIDPRVCLLSKGEGRNANYIYESIRRNVHFAFVGIGLMTEAASTSETSVNFYQTTRRNIPEDIFIFAAVRT
jgi:hypothetical protein